MGGWRGFGLARMRLWIGRGRGRFWEPGWCGFDDVDLTMWIVSCTRFFFKMLVWV